jgi:carboxyl-terminal processing protease
MVLDLRQNSGGYLNAAVEVADLYLGGGKKIVYTQGRVPGSTEEYFAEDQTSDCDIPLVVLIDAGSASASEIVAGAVQDWDRGVVAGHTSFGKGLVQRPYHLRNGGELLLTVARYYTPTGRLIQRPYEAGDRMDYYRRAGGGAADSAAAPADTAGRPAFRTLLQGRTVYGGGGISPDVTIDEVYRTSRLNQDLTAGRKYFDYADDLRDNDRIGWQGDFEQFLQGFRPSDEMVAGFKGFLEKQDFAFDADSFAVHADEIRRGISAEIARALWGEEQRYRVLIRDDPGLARAVELLPQAEAMLTDAHRIEAEAVARDETAGAGARRGRNTGATGNR